MFRVDLVFYSSYLLDYYGFYFLEILFLVLFIIFWLWEEIECYLEMIEMILIFWRDSCFIVVEVFRISFYFCYNVIIILV